MWRQTPRSGHASSQQTRRRAVTCWSRSLVWSALDQPMTADANWHAIDRRVAVARSAARGLRDRLALILAAPRLKRSRSAVIDSVTAVAAPPTITASPIRAIASVGSPPRGSPVHTRDRPTGRPPPATPIAASPHHRTRWDGRSGDNGHWGRSDSGGGRSFGHRRRRRGLKVRGANLQSGYQHDCQCGDSREKSLTHEHPPLDDS